MQSIFSHFLRVGIAFFVKCLFLFIVGILILIHIFDHLLKVCDQSIFQSMTWIINIDRIAHQTNPIFDIFVDLKVDCNEVNPNVS